MLRAGRVLHRWDLLPGQRGVLRREVLQRLLLPRWEDLLHRHRLLLRQRLL
jgi:hypothetical protein